MRAAGRLAASVLDMIEPFVQPGATTDELDKRCHDFIVDELKSIPANLNYRGFPKTICTSVNHVVCHGIPGDKRLKGGDIINIDVTVIRDGFHGDTSRMYFVGVAPVLARRLTAQRRGRPETGIRPRQTSWTEIARHHDRGDAVEIREDVEERRRRDDAPSRAQSSPDGQDVSFSGWSAGGCACRRAALACPGAGCRCGRWVESPAPCACGWTPHWSPRWRRTRVATVTRPRPI